MAQTAAGAVGSRREDDGLLANLRHRVLQQSLPAKQLDLEPAVALRLLGGLGFLLVVIGVCVLAVTSSVEEYRVDYTDLSQDQPVGKFEITVERDMQPPIWIYYELDGFHQNHRRYAGSRDEDQLRQTPKWTHRQEEGAHAQCKLWAYDPDGRPQYPCGLIARSVFNDSFAVLVQEADKELFRLLRTNSSAAVIGWKADAEKGYYQNLNPEGVFQREKQYQDAFNMWLTDYFPPVECRQVDFTADHPHKPVKVAEEERELRLPGGNVVVGLADCTGYGTDSPQCNFERDGVPFTCNRSNGYERVVHKEWGVTSGHFLAWMRIAALPTFRKAWARIDEPIQLGSTLQVHFTDDFPIKSMGGRKAFVLSTTSSLGGRSFLGVAYLLVGVILLSFRLQGKLPGHA
mmetsp:Transcript_63824/g.152224  ORF Transcript_63824/g.152224 Transcript_63824/m.152224 type:complete len:402 (-) Transcript_63824:231-1436(-)